MKRGNFALMERVDIGQPGEPPLLTRWRVVQTPRAALYVHHHHRPDADRELHDHPWSFLSWVVKGSYIERLALPVSPRRTSMDTERPIRAAVGTVHRARWPVGFRRATELHRIESIEHGTWTVLFVGRRRRDWGFATDQGWVQWEQFTAERAATA